MTLVSIETLLEENLQNADLGSPNLTGSIGILGLEFPEIAYDPLSYFIVSSVYL